MKTIYICEGCGEQYRSPDEAVKCESQGAGERLVEVGDIASATAGFGWYDGDKRWIINPDVALKQSGLNDWKKCLNGDENCFNMCCTYGFYYVVTAIDVHKHRVRYHLATRAMSGKQGYRRGYTFNEHHIPPTKVASPSEFLVRSSRGLIGEKAATLL